MLLFQPGIIYISFPNKFLIILQSPDQGTAFYDNFLDFCRQNCLIVPAFLLLFVPCVCLCIYVYACNNHLIVQNNNIIANFKILLCFRHCTLSHLILTSRRWELLFSISRFSNSLKVTKLIHSRASIWVQVLKFLSLHS